MLSHLIVKQAVMLATDDVFYISGVIFVALIVVVWFARPPARLNGGPVAAD